MMDETTTSTLPNPALIGSSAADMAATPARFSLKRAYLHTVSASVVARLLGAASGILAARLLGPIGRGELAIIVLLPLTLLPLGELELPRALAYEVSRSGGKAPARLVSSGLWLGFGLGCLEMFLLAGILKLFLPPDKSYLLHDARLFTVYLPLVFVLTCSTGLEQGRGRFGHFSILQAAPLAIYLTVIVVGYSAGVTSPRIFASGIVLGAAIPAIIKVATEGRAVWAKPQWNTSRSLLARSVSFYFPALAALALTRADTFLLVRLLSIKQVGLYIVAQAVASGAMGISPFVQVGFADVASESRKADALLTLARHFRLAQLATLGIGVFSCMLASPVIHLAFGTGFEGAAAAAYILIVAMGFCGLGQVLDQGLRAAGHPKVAAICNLAGLVVLCGLGVAGSARFGIVGLASAALSGYVVTLTGLLLFCVFKLKVSVHVFWAFEKNTLRELSKATRAVLRRLTSAKIVTRADCEGGSR